MNFAPTQQTRKRVIVVDDSRSIRRWLRFMLEADPRLEVVGEAGSAREARDLLKQTAADVMTLDVDMPGMNGLEFLSRLMMHHPMPVVMVSALTEQGSQEAIEALSRGAVDCIEKPRSSLTPDIGQDICERVWSAAQSRVQDGRSSQTHFQRRARPVEQHPWMGEIILLGASTGGVSALESILPEIDNCDAPIVIAQHMPENFLRSFCRRLNDLFSHRFVMAEDGLVLQSRQAVVAVGKEVSTRLTRSTSGRITCQLGPPSDTAVYRPSIDDLFESAAYQGCSGAAAILTGMGDDGARGLLALRKRGFATMIQNEDSCVVYGMPKAAGEMGAAELSLEPARIGKAIAARMMPKSAQEGLET